MVAATAIGATALVAVVDPSQPGHYPACPILAVSGLYCPGCGGLRAVHALIEGDVALALDLNALVVAALPIALACYVGWVMARLANRSRPSTAVGVAGVAAGRRTAGARWGALAALVVCLGFAVLRNLPAFAWLAP